MSKDQPENWLFCHLAICCAAAITAAAGVVLWENGKSIPGCGLMVVAVASFVCMCTAIRIELQTSSFGNVPATRSLVSDQPIRWSQAGPQLADLVWWEESGSRPDVVLATRMMSRLLEKCQ